MDLSRVNEFFKTNNKEDDITTETEIIFSGPDAIKNILINETVKIGKLESINNELLKYLTDSKAIKALSYKEKQHLFSTINDVESNSRDFIFKVAELANKNAFLQEVLMKLSNNHNIVTSQNGEKYITSLDEETRKNLSEILVDIVNERVRNT